MLGGGQIELTITKIFEICKFEFDVKISSVMTTLGVIGMVMVVDMVMLMYLVLAE